MTSFAHKSDPRRRQYARYAQTVLEGLREAVARRTAEGLSQRQIAERIDMAPSSLTRVLNGRVKNLTIKTISDILWASEHEPSEFNVDALEDISGNYVPKYLVSVSLPGTFTKVVKSTQGTATIEQKLVVRQLELA